MKRSWAGRLGRDDIGRTVAVKGWVQRRRDHGGVVFLDLRDRSGVVQVVLRQEDHPDVAEALSAVRVEWVIGVEGEVVARDDAAINPEMTTGEIELLADAGEVLARSDPPPVAPESKVDASEETRLKYRYLELREPALQRNLMLRHRATLEIWNYLDEHEFVHLETPILTRSTPEGARDYLVPSRIHRGSFYALPQSPQLFKQLFMVAGLERYAQIARCFRDEDLRADRQPEFTQIDLEMSFVEEEDVIALVEGLLERVFALVGVEVERPFPQLSWDDAMRRFGTDRPDLRFDMEITDLSELLGASGFRGFKSAVAEGGVVRGVVVPGGAAASRREIDGWVELARRHGALGALTLKKADGEITFQVKSALDRSELEAAAAALQLNDGDLALVVAGPAATTAAALGALRLGAAVAYGQIPENEQRFAWVREFPLLEWNQDEARWEGSHHPFTAPLPGDLERLETDPGGVRSRAYDVVLNGTELGGGSIRIHDRATQERVFRVLGIGAEEARRRFGFFLDALRYGAPPHGGIALGLDRLVMLMAGARSLREVIAFPKTTSALCLMTEAPSEVDPGQLAELGLRLAGGPDDGSDDGSES